MKIQLNERTVLAGATLIAVVSPFLWVKFVPATDLPQHLAQVRLFFDYLGGNHHDDLKLNLFAPNNLVYLPLILAWLVFPPVLAGKALMLLLAVGSAAATLYFAHKNGRPIESAALVSILIFNGSFYWGFINFLIGWPVFLWWMHLVMRRGKIVSSWKGTLLEAFVAFLLLCSHALWFAVGVTVMFVLTLLDRSSWRVFLRHALAFVPSGLFVAAWYPHFWAARASIGFDNSARWLTMPWKRFLPTWIIDATMGGLRGPAEAVLCIGIAAWIVVSVAPKVRESLKSVDLSLVVAGGLICLFALAGPDKYVNTIRFATRWWPVGVTLIVLSLPLPRKSTGFLFGYPLLVLVVFAVVTSLAWRNFDTNELDGFSESLNAVPDNARVLGLDYVRESTEVMGQPFMQLFSYAQVIHGGELNFSFTWHQSGIVVLEKTPKVDWTLGLEWLPEFATRHDIDAFDVTLVNGSDETHHLLDSAGMATPLTFRGRWRAYEPRR